MTRKTRFSITAAGTALFIAAGFDPGQAQQAAADLVIRGGTIYPGDAAPFRGDVAICGDRIVYVGLRALDGASKIIDATGQIVAPGFIDPHTHVDDALASNDPAARLVLPFLMQGVTTASIGVDGGGDPDIASTFGHPGGDSASRDEAIGDVDRYQPDDQQQWHQRRILSGHLNVL